MCVMEKSQHTIERTRSAFSDKQLDFEADAERLHTQQRKFILYTWEDRYLQSKKSQKHHYDASSTCAHIHVVLPRLPYIKYMYA